MSHSHLAIRHLVKKLEMSGGRQNDKAPLPRRISQLIDDLSQLFEPFNGIARAGYECQKSESGWEISLFLGEHELVGGPGDGELRAVNFRFDLQQLPSCFDSVAAIHWNAFPSSHACFDDLADLSIVTIRGVVQEHPVHVQIHAGPPTIMGPAMREFSDGRLELA